MPSPQDWASAQAPTISEFEELAAAAWQRLPAEFRALCQGLSIRVEDFASDEILQALNIESPFDLMGLYQGVSLNRKSVMDTPQGPDMVFLYRRALLDYWSENSETLGHLVTHVLVHEIGHHFGFSDADMERIERAIAD
jgi:predicted Zn-dependent protease with MMP-like domain